MSSRERDLEETKKVIRSLLISQKDGMILSELSKDFWDVNGYQIPFQKFGFVTLQQFCESIPDVCQIIRVRDEIVLKAVPDAKTEHLNRLVQRQKASGGKATGTKRAQLGIKSMSEYNRQCLRPTNVPRTGSSPQRPRHQKYSSDCEHNIPAELQSSLRKLLQDSHPDGIPAAHLITKFERAFDRQLNYKKYGFASLRSFLKELDFIDTEDFHTGGYRVMLKSSQKVQRAAANGGQVGSVALPGLSVLNNDDDDDDDEDDEVKVNLKLVLDDYKNGIHVTKLQTEYKKLTGHDLPYKQRGFTNAVSLLDASGFHIERPDSRGDWIVTGRKQGHREVKDLYLRELCEVIDKHADGVLLSNLSEIFENETGKEIYPSLFGYSSFDELADKLHGKAFCKYTVEGYVKLYPLTQGLNLDGPMSVEMDAFSLPGGTSFPDDVVSDCLYTLRSYPSTMFPCQIIHVEHPGYFHFRLLADEVLQNEIVNEMNNIYYGQHSMEYMMPDAMFVIGHPCAARNEGGDWRRAKVTGVAGLDFVEVFFVDFGDYSRVASSDCRLLKSCFMKPPTLALQGMLAAVAPIDGEVWSREAIASFENFVTGRNLYAIIHEKLEDGSASVFLCDTRGKEDIYINDLLCDEKLAVVKPVGCAVEAKMSDEEAILEPGQSSYHHHNAERNGLSRSVEESAFWRTVIPTLRGAQSCKTLESSTASHSCSSGDATLQCVCDHHAKDDYYAFSECSVSEQPEDLQSQVLTSDAVELQSVTSVGTSSSELFHKSRACPSDVSSRQSPKQSQSEDCLEDDADMFFFRSLLPHVRELSRQNKRKFQQATMTTLFNILSEQDEH